MVLRAPGAQWNTPLGAEMRSGSDLLEEGIRVGRQVLTSDGEHLGSLHSFVPKKRYQQLQVLGMVQNPRPSSATHMWIMDDGSICSAPQGSSKFSTPTCIFQVRVRWERWEHWSISRVTCGSTPNSPRNGFPVHRQPAVHPTRVHGGPTPIFG